MKRNEKNVAKEEVFPFSGQRLRLQELNTESSTTTLTSLDSYELKKVKIIFFFELLTLNFWSCFMHVLLNGNPP